MKRFAETPPADAPHHSVLPVLSAGDDAWASRPAFWRERELALPWPPELLRAFSHRMASHGMSVSQTMMLGDRKYALQQLAHAHSMADDTLRSMAVELFRHASDQLAVRGPAVH